MRRRRDVRDWVVKAEEDWLALNTLLRKRPPRLNTVVCFHAQQSAEKYLKAVLTSHRIAFPKTHDLLGLLTLAKRAETTLEVLRPFLEYLQPYAVDFRYPGEVASRAEALRSSRFAAQIREHVRRILGL